MLSGRAVREANIAFLGRMPQIEAIARGADWFFVYSSDAGSFTLSYNRAASETSYGYHFTTDDTFSAVSETSFTFLGLTFHFPVPTRYVRAFGPFEADYDVSFFFDDYSPDGVIEHKENLARVLASSAPGLTEVKRYYTDWFDFTGDPALVAPLTEYAAEHAVQRSNIVSAAGHGIPSGCCALSSYMSLPSFDVSGITYADSCLTGRFTTNFGDSMAEELTVNAAGGSTAYVGNTGLSWIGAGNGFEMRFWERMARNPMLSAMHTTISEFQASNTDRWANYSLTLFGDPEQSIWRGAPRALVVEAPESITRDLTLGATDERGWRGAPVHSRSDDGAQRLRGRRDRSRGAHHVSASRLARPRDGRRRAVRLHSERNGNRGAPVSSVARFAG